MFNLLIKFTDKGPICHIYKSMNVIRSLSRENFYFSNQSFEIWWLIRGMEVMKEYKISAQYLKLCLLDKTTQGHGL